MMLVLLIRTLLILRKYANKLIIFNAIGLCSPSLPGHHEAGVQSRSDQRSRIEDAMLKSLLVAGFAAVLAVSLSFADQGPIEDRDSGQ